MGERRLGNAPGERFRREWAEPKSIPNFELGIEQLCGGQK